MFILLIYCIIFKNIKYLMTFMIRFITTCGNNLLSESNRKGLSLSLNQNADNSEIMALVGRWVRCVH